MLFLYRTMTTVSQHIAECSICLSVCLSVCLLITHQEQQSCVWNIFLQYSSDGFLTWWTCLSVMYVKANKDDHFSQLTLLAISAVHLIFLFTWLIFICQIFTCCKITGRKYLNHDPALLHYKYCKWLLWTSCIAWATHRGTCIGLNRCIAGFYSNSSIIFIVFHVDITVIYSSWLETFNLLKKLCYLFLTVCFHVVEKC